MKAIGGDGNSVNHGVGSICQAFSTVSTSVACCSRKALSRRYQDAIKALLRLYSGDLDEGALHWRELACEGLAELRQVALGGAEDIGAWIRVA